MLSLPKLHESKAQRLCRVDFVANNFVLVQVNFCLVSCKFGVALVVVADGIQTNFLQLHLVHSFAHVADAEASFGEVETREVGTKLAFAIVE